MNTEYNENDLNNIVNEHELVLLYFWSKNCGVCNVHKPQINKVGNEYNKVKIIEIEVEKNLETSSQYSIFTVPAVLLFVRGNESLRQARYINFLEIEETIKRYYDLLNS